MFASLLGEFTPYIIGAATLIAAFFGYTHKVKRDAEKTTRADIETAAVKEYVETRKEIDNATPIDVVPSSARDRLRERQANRNSKSDN